jgi:hypothetical protein
VRRVLAAATRPMVRCGGDPTMTRQPGALLPPVALMRRAGKRKWDGKVLVLTIAGRRVVIQAVDEIDPLRDRDRADERRACGA